MTWVQCPRCGSCRDKYEEPCGCIVIACDACLLVEINSDACIVCMQEWEREMSGKNNQVVYH